jgi:hypothetical protein
MATRHLTAHGGMRGDSSPFGHGLVLLQHLEVTVPLCSGTAMFGLTLTGEACPFLLANQECPH